jgi:hypothetical protein
MSEIPDSKATVETLALWYKTREELDKLKAKEALLRPVIYKTYFPNPSEGTNTFVLPDQYQLKAIRKIDRKVDEATMHQFNAPIEGKNVSKFEEVEVSSSRLFKPKYELVISEYRKLTEEQLKVVDQVLIIKDGMPQLDITPPSTRAPKK